jgi:hypothetical protein
MGCHRELYQPEHPASKEQESRTVHSSVDSAMRVLAATTVSQMIQRVMLAVLGLFAVACSENKSEPATRSGALFQPGVSSWQSMMVDGQGKSAMFAAYLLNLGLEEPIFAPCFGVWEDGRVLLGSLRVGDCSLPEIWAVPPRNAAELRADLRDWTARVSSLAPPSTTLHGRLLVVQVRDQEGWHEVFRNAAASESPTADEWLTEMSKIIARKLNGKAKSSDQLPVKLASKTVATEPPRR